MGTLETPQDRHRYIHRTGPPEWNRQTEVQVEQGAQEAMAEQGAREAMAEQGAREAMAEQGAREAMAEQGAREAMVGPPPRPRPQPPPQSLRPEPYYPPQNFLGEAQGYQEPSGAKHNETVKKTVVTDWSNTATAGWLVNTAAAGWGYHNRLA